MDVFPETDRRSMFGRAPDERARLALPLAAILFVGSGGLALISLPTVPGRDARIGTVVVGIIALAIGLFVWLTPSTRWSVVGTFALAPAALILISVANALGSHEPYDYAVFYVIVHAWVGLALPRRSSMYLAPVTIAAFLLPLPTIANDVTAAAMSVFVVVPACVLIGEGIAWLMRSLGASETVRDELTEALARVEFTASHDSVTGLPNRAAFYEHLDLALARARRSGDPLVVCSLDLDKFKLVNDTLGHAAGDDLLGAVAARLRSVVREGDVVARVGGDEFLLLMPEPGPASTDPDAISARIRDSLEAPVPLKETEIYVSASIGMGVFPMDGDDGDTLLRVADAKMYRTKRSRSSRGPVATIGHHAPDDELELSSRLRASAKVDSWALRYQPIVELVAGRTVGAEALIRWNDPARGLRAPHEFLELAHELDLGEALTRWVIEELGSVGRGWRQDGILDGLTMLTINLSPRELWATSLVERLQRLASILARPQLLVVEVTEEALAMDVDRARVVLGACRRAGIRIAIDDFGTGYSSLARLGSLPIDIVKVDRQFLHGIDRDPDARRVLRSMIRLISSLDMAAIAEGIEDPAQLDVVIEEGFALAQGFLFGPPMGEERFREELDAAHQALRWLSYHRPVRPASVALSDRVVEVG